MLLEKIILEKIVMGITLAAPIGPVSIEMIKRGLKKGFLAAFVVRAGGAVGNTLYLILAYFWGSLLMTSQLSIGLCTLVGAGVLIYLGIKALLDKRTHDFSHVPADQVDTLDQTDTSDGLLNGLIKGFVLSVLNPIGLAFWVSIFVGSGAADVGLMQNFAVIAGVLIWGLLLSGFLGITQGFFKPKWIKMITTGAGILLIYFGLKYAYSASKIFIAI